MYGFRCSGRTPMEFASESSKNPRTMAPEFRVCWATPDSGQAGRSVGMCSHRYPQAFPCNPASTFPQLWLAAPSPGITVAPFKLIRVAKIESVSKLVRLFHESPCSRSPFCPLSLKRWRPQQRFGSV
ncbi:hypothetical protein BT67DRAFT_258741 [Trichocladium antarcticum]|uniref:Uncharacterized protein n=1 Tax=Trichocladium antarcticum TaxID=1450529 RepID=A0AAN6UN33_9PEZI|nr:hypothetical protein BT67DRAFT_258741 [Trichocladium antarcticum]